MKGSDPKLREGSILSAWNARSIYEAASASFDRGSYGLASSLFVLSGEEAAKSIGLYFESVCDGAEKSYEPEMFYSHKAKHAKGSHYLHVIHGMAQLCIPSDDRPSCPVGNGKCTMDADCPILSSYDRWDSTANTIKKKGFYVDIDNGEWHSPLDVSHEVCSEVQFTAEHLLKLCEVFSLYDPIQ